MTQISLDRNASTVYIMPGLSVFPFYDCALWYCIILILPYADSRVCPVCLILSFQVWERAFGMTMPMFLTQSLRQELASYYLQLSQTFSLSQKGALKLEFSIVTLNRAIFMQMHRAAFPSPLLQKKRTAYLKHSSEKQNSHCCIHSSFCTCTKYRGWQNKKLSKILLNTIKYSENKIVMLLPWEIKKNPSSNVTRGNGTEWQTNWGKSLQTYIYIYMWHGWYLKIYSKILKSHLSVSKPFSTIKIWFSAMVRQDELTHGSYSTVTSLVHIL